MLNTTRSRHTYARPRNPIRRPATALALAAAIIGLFSTSVARAQEFADPDEIVSESYVGNGGATRLMLQPQSGQRPKMGFMGHMMSGWGMMVDQVIPGTTAARMGLEPGDVVMKINGKPVTCAQRYRELLWEAVSMQDGRVHLKVDNIRARNGLPVPRYAFVTGWLNFGGYSAAGSQPMISTEN